MSRSYPISALVTLPRLSAPTALALGTVLYTVYKQQGGPPPPILHKPAERLGQAVGALRAARLTELDAPKPDTGAAVVADVRLDTAWAAFYLVLQGWAKLPATSAAADKAEAAQHLIDFVFPDGLAFTQAPYKVEWAESQQRLDWLGKPENVEHIKELGAEPIVDEAREAYEAYGEAIQITAQRSEAKAVRVSEHFGQMTSALRRYVLSVISYADDNEGDLGALALADTLLAPLAAWEPPGGRKGKGKGEPADEPAPGGGPAQPPQGGGPVPQGEVDPLDPSWPMTD